MNEAKDEDGYVDDWQIRKYSDCHPSSATRIFTNEEVEEKLKAERERVKKVIIGLIDATEDAETNLQAIYETDILEELLKELGLDK